MASFHVDGIALITGAASGIGRDTGFTFAEAGARGVVFADIDFDGASEAAQQSSKYATNSEYEALAVEVNVTDEVSVKRMVDAAIAKFGRIDYNINSAGIFTRLTPIWDLDIAEMDRVHSINVKGVALCMRFVLAAMKDQEPREFETRSGRRSLGRGAVVNLGSLSSYAAGYQMTSYISSKHAVLGLTKAAAHDVADYDIRVNTVCPTFVQTAMTAPMQEKVDPAVLNRLLPKIGRMAVPDEISGVILFLCSPAATYVHGTSVMIDAGHSLPCRN